MLRLLSILSLAVAICTVCGQSPTPSVTEMPAMTTSMVQATTSVHAPTTNSMHATTSTHSMTHSPMASVTPTPTPAPEPPNPNPNPTENNYYINSSNTSVCLHLKGGFSIKFNYTDKDKPRHRIVDFLKNTTVVHPDSICDAATQKAVLKLEYKEYNNPNPYYLNFTFAGHNDKKNWNVTQMMVEFTFRAADFPGYNGSASSGSFLSSTSKDSLLEQNIDLDTSFMCNANRTIMGFDELADKSLGVSLFVSELQVQAFNFTNTTSGAFDNAVHCLEDQSGNKVVPIAVGAALAGLVIVVLIAYLIGRLRNRKKSSYEALS